jgi:hypothetical protein
LISLENGKICAGVITAQPLLLRTVPSQSPAGGAMAPATEIHRVNRLFWIGAVVALWVVLVVGGILQP